MRKQVVFHAIFATAWGTGIGLRDFVFLCPGAMALYAIFAMAWGFATVLIAMMLQQVS